MLLSAKEFLKYILTAILQAYNKLKPASEQHCIGKHQNVTVQNRELLYCIFDQAEFESFFQKHQDKQKHKKQTILHAELGFY